jgi:hypothetical protein
VISENQRLDRLRGVKLRCRVEEIAGVPRLASAALTVWLAIVGGASPAIACASLDPHDCCPPVPADPCSDHPAPRSDSGASLSCCPAAPGAAALVNSPPARTELAKLTASDDPDRGLFSVADVRLDLRSADSLPAALPSRRPAADGRMTYLRTQRLRL